MERRFMITGGGTSGHINPALAIADLLVEVAEETVMNARSFSREER